MLPTKERRKNAVRESEQLSTLLSPKLRVTYHYWRHFIGIRPPCCGWTESRLFEIEFPRPFSSFVLLFSCLLSSTGPSCTSQMIILPSMLLLTGKRGGRSCCLSGDKASVDIPIRKRTVTSFRKKELCAQFCTLAFSEEP